MGATTVDVKHSWSPCTLYSDCIHVQLIFALNVSQCILDLQIPRALFEGMFVADDIFGKMHCFRVTHKMQRNKNDADWETLCWRPYRMDALLVIGGTPPTENVGTCGLMCRKAQFYGIIINF